MSRAPPPPHLRQEIFALGGRHLGDPLGGARRELKDASISAGRRKLLEAVVRHLDDEAKVPPDGPAQTLSADILTGRTALVYGAILIASLIWSATVICGFFP